MDAPKANKVQKRMATKAQQALEALAKIETLKVEAIQELLAERQKIDDQLAQLGHTGGKGTTRKRGGASKPAGERYCNICEAQGHDARAHRGQGKNKKKFSAAEMKELGASA